MMAFKYEFYMNEQTTLTFSLRLFFPSKYTTTELARNRFKATREDIK